MKDSHTTTADAINTEAELDEALTLPSSALVRSIEAITNPLVILGAGGKMGPTLAVLARRAAQAANRDLEVIAVSRFSDPRARDWLQSRGVKTVSCDLLDAGSVARLPDTQNVIYLVGLKFGTAQNPAATWAMNTIVPSRVAERFAGARIVMLSTGNVYPLSEVSRGGSREMDPLTPLGEYANAAVARERVFEFYSSRNGTPMAFLRLYYAVELRYGIVVDIARKVSAGDAIQLANGYFNCIWQGDANDMVLRSLPLARAPVSIWNLCRPECFSVREVALRLGELLGKTPKFSDAESPTAFLGNATKLCSELGPPPTPMDTILRRVAHWVRQGGRSLGKPTGFEVRDGKY